MITKKIYRQFIMLCLAFTLNSILATHNCCYAADVIFEGFDTLSKFKGNKAPKAEIKVSLQPGMTGNALRIDYDLTNDHFVEVGTPVSIYLDKVKDINWYMKGDINGSVFEIKFVDEDGSTFGKKIPVTAVSPDEWRHFRLPLKECHYMWGGDKNVGTIKEFWLAASRGLAKKGYVLLDNFSYTPKAKGAADLDINLNQVGYHPADIKYFVARLTGADNDNTVSGEFTVQETVDGAKVISGKLVKALFTDWEGVYLKGDFSSLDTNGKYTVTVKVRTKLGIIEKTSYKFNINNHVLSALTLAHELSYLNYQRCGIRCHKNDPVMGGWHDTLFDISKRMWSIPSLVYGLALYAGEGPIHVSKTPEGAIGDLEELIWGLEFITALPDSDGAVPWAGIEADFQKFMSYEQFIARIGPLKPEDDLLPRVRYPEKNFHATAFNLAALVKSIPVVKSKNAALARKAESVAYKAWGWLDAQPLNEARDYGAYLWAATELYKFNSDKKFLHRVNEITPKLLALQALNFRQFENSACGDFYTSRSAKDFRYQYKYVSFNIAINMALLNLSEILTPEDALWFDVYYANRVFGENYLKGISSKTPYQQAAHGLEPNKPKSQVSEEWQCISDAGVTGAFELKKDKKSDFISLEFEFAGGFWTQVSKQLLINLEELDDITFDYKYSGQPNILELKITDSQGTHFGHRIELEPSDKWTAETVGRNQLKFFWGNSTSLDFKNIRNIWFAVAKTSGGNGVFSLRNVALNLENGETVNIPISGGAEDSKYLLNYFAGPEAEMAAASNHGLNCDHLGLAYIGMRTGYLFGDTSYEEFADNQVNWVMGANPLNYCMLIGAGSENPAIMSEYFGKPTVNGIIPNGIVGGSGETPEWWGDGASSGEDWLPHNAAYFLALSVLDSPAKVFGKILFNGEILPNTTVELRENDRPVTRAVTKANGLFGPIQVPSQKRYRMVIFKEGNSATLDMPLLSGENKRIVFDLSRKYDLDILPEGRIEAGKKTNLKILLSRNALGQDYKIFIKGAKLNYPMEGVIQTESIILPIVPENDKPLMVVFMIKGYPPVYKTFYLKAY